MVLIAEIWGLWLDAKELGRYLVSFPLELRRLDRKTRYLQEDTVDNLIGAHGSMSRSPVHHCTRKSLTVEFSWARLQWLGFKRSYLIGVGKVSCKKCGRIFTIEEGTVQKALAKRAVEFKQDLQDIALEREG
jgi:hypothetical protein